MAAGTGQHAEAFARLWPTTTWQPTDLDAGNLESIAAWTADHANVLPPRAVDVRLPVGHWGVSGPWDLIFNANMIHIAPWECCVALMRGAARYLAADGMLVTYGPYLEQGVPTSPGNLAFDASLRTQNSQWGLRALEDVARQAEAAGLHLSERHAMPANNLLLVWRRSH